jgi:hypothetical protein
MTPLIGYGTPYHVLNVMSMKPVSYAPDSEGTNQWESSNLDQSQDQSLGKVSGGRWCQWRPTSSIAMGMSHGIVG